MLTENNKSLTMSNKNKEDKNMLPQKKALGGKITEKEETTKHMLTKNSKALTRNKKNKEDKNMLSQKKVLGE